MSFREDSHFSAREREAEGGQEQDKGRLLISTATRASVGRVESLDSAD